MPKMKTHRSAAKRFARTGSGKLVRMQAGVNHLLEHKPSRRKRHLQHAVVISAPDARRASRLLGD
jgi:large subunit ribosomal protein L35